MKSMFCLVLAFCCVSAFAKATTQPSDASPSATTKPAVAQGAKAATTQPAVAEGAATAATKPAVAKSANPAATQPTARHYPTPAELIEKMKAQKAKRDAMPKIAYFDLSEQLREKPADFSFLGDHDALTLKTLLDRLHQAQDDKSVRAVLITLGGASPSFAQAQEIRDALLELNKSGKQTFVYADSYNTDSYTLATGAQQICMLEGGDIMLPGVGLQTMFAKGLLDKIGVQADAIQIGEYKGADEEFTRTGPSDELRGELNKLTQSLYDEIVDGISLNRNLTREDVRRDIDDCIIRGPIAKRRGLVDHLVDEDGLRQLIKNETNEKDMRVIADYGEEHREAPDFSNPFALFAAMARRPAVSDKPAVALIYAVGTIVDGKGGDGMFGSAIGGDDIRDALRTAMRDPDVKSVVLRINSPGGSALASEVMWQAARNLAKKKPLIVSVGGMAASGGYYLASAGDTIYADPSAIVGSIGVVGGKFVFKDLMQKLGLSTETFSKGRNADLFSSQTPFTERQRRTLTQGQRHT
jgi:protease-4